MRSRRTALHLLALVVSGGVQPLISAPLNLWFLHPFVLAPGLWVISREEPRRAALYGFVMGLVANLGIFYWLAPTLARFGDVSLPVGLFALLLFASVASLFMALFGWGLHRVRAVAGAHWPFAGAALFTACEFLVPQLFPYYHGISFYQQPAIFLVTSVTGIAGMTYQVILWNLLLVAWAEHLLGLRALPAAARWTGLGFTALLLAASVGISRYQSSRIARAEVAASPLEVALVQANADIAHRADLGPRGMAEAHVRVSREALERDPSIDVLVWPEGALRRRPFHRSNASVRALLADTDVELWTGAITREGRGDRRRSFNSAYVWRSDGSIGGRYDKVYLLPFGEYTPLREWMGSWPRGRTEYAAGDGQRALRAAGGARPSFLVCYEGILREPVRHTLPPETNLLVNVTYDAWFGDTSCPAQHLMMAAARSAELGLPMVRVATTGISAFVDARGVLVRQTRVFTEDVLVGEVRPLRVATFYGAFGDWFAWSCVLVSLVLLMRGRATSSPRPSHV